MMERQGEELRPLARSGWHERRPEQIAIAPSELRGAWLAWCARHSRLVRLLCAGLQPSAPRK